MEEMEANLCDFALFLTVMKEKKAYRNMLSIILEEPDIQLKEVKDLKLEDGTTKIFLNMTSKNGSKELVSLLQYIKKTDINNPEILVKDERLLEFDEIVTEVKESEEWEAVRRDILDVGIKKGLEQGRF